MSLDMSDVFFSDMIKSAFYVRNIYKHKALS